MASYSQMEVLYMYQLGVKEKQAIQRPVEHTLENIDCRLKLQDLTNLIQECNCTIGLQRHRHQTAISQIVRDFSADYNCQLHLRSTVCQDQRTVVLIGIFHQLSDLRTWLDVGHNSGRQRDRR